MGRRLGTILRTDCEICSHGDGACYEQCGMIRAFKFNSKIPFVLLDLAMKLGLERESVRYVVVKLNSLLP